MRLSADLLGGLGIEQGLIEEGHHLAHEIDIGIVMKSIGERGQVGLPRVSGAANIDVDASKAQSEFSRAYSPSRPCHLLTDPASKVGSSIAEQQDPFKRKLQPPAGKDCIKKFSGLVEALDGNLFPA